jgi:uncharacterized protein (TIGR00266 family)
MQINVLYRPSQAMAQVWLQAGESVMAETGAMVGMTPNVQMQTQAGGLGKSLMRMLGGESFFRNTFTAQGGNGEVLFAPPLCGDLAVLDVGHQQWSITQSCFVASSPTVDIETTGGGFKGLFSGAGLFTLKTSGYGQVIVGSFGALEQVMVDGSMVIDTGHLVAWDANLQYTVGKSGGGWIASFLSGEGLVCHFQGRGMLYLQSRNATEYGQAIGPMLPPIER